MESINVGVASWIIQDGNYNDFTVGQKAEFALEFYPHSLKSSDCWLPSATLINASKYRICGQVVYLSEDVWVLDMGFLAYQESPPPKYVTKGSWIEGEVYVGIDPFFYFERLKSLSGFPELTYSFKISQIFLETTPWLAKTDEFGRQMRVRDDEKECFREVVETDASNDDSGDAHYVLKCISVDEHL